MTKLMLLPLTDSCFSKIQDCFTFLVPAHLGSRGQRAVKQVLLLSPPLSLGHLLRDDLINPVKMSVRTYVHMSTMKHNVATSQIVVFVMTFKVIRGQGQGQEMISVSSRDYFYINIFSLILSNTCSTRESMAKLAQVFLHTGFPSCCPTNSVKALKEMMLYGCIYAFNG